MAGAPERIALDTQGQAMTHAQLGAHARAAHGRIATTVPSGLRPEHAALLTTALGRARDSLHALAQRNENAVGACQDFGTTEDGNEAAVSDLENNIPTPI